MGLFENAAQDLNYKAMEVDTSSLSQTQYINSNSIYRGDVRVDVYDLDDEADSHYKATDTLTTEDLEFFIGQMSDKEYADFVKEIENYYGNSIKFYEQLLSNAEEMLNLLNDSKALEMSAVDYLDQNAIGGRKDEIMNQLYWFVQDKKYEGTGVTREELEKMTEEERIQYIIKYDEEAKRIYDEWMQAKTKVADEYIKSKFSELGIINLDDYIKCRNTLIDQTKNLKEAIKTTKNLKQSAYYDNLKYLSDYNNYKEHKLTDEERDYVKKKTYSSPTMTDSYDYNDYHNKFPDATPLDFVKLLQEIQPNGNYTVTGIPDLQNLKTIANVCDKIPNLSKTYEYLYSQSPEKASEYLKDIQYELNNIEGQLRAEKFLSLLGEADGKNDVLETIANELGVSVEGLTDGLNSFGSGVGYSFEALLTSLGIIEENRTLSAEEYKKMYILYGLMDEESKIKTGLVQNNAKGELENINPNSIIDYTKTYSGGITLKWNYEISQGIGNMLPSVVLSYACPIAGSVALGVSAGGNAYHESMVNGDSLFSSIMYGVFTGSSEAISERILGGLPGLSDVQVTSFATYAKSMAKEGFQESFQGVMDAVYRATVMGEELPTTVEDWKEFGLDIMKQGAYGAVTAGIMQAPSLAPSLYRKLKQIKTKKILSPEQYPINKRIVEKFGIDKCRELDWDLIESGLRLDHCINFRDILMTIDSQTEDINSALYDLVKDQIKPIQYSPKMKEIYSDRLIDISEYSDEDFKSIICHFNEGKVNLKEIINNWDIFKEKDLSYCLLNDSANTNHITNDILKDFMANYGNLASLLVENYDIYTLIYDISNLSTEEEKHNYLKQFTDDILSNTYRKDGDYRPPIKLTDEQYKEIFKYSSFEDYLNKITSGNANRIIEDLKVLPDDYVFNLPFSFSDFLNSKVLRFAEICGIKNIVDFDNECNHFFTKDNNKMLKQISSYLINFSHPTTKEEFYNLIRKLVTIHSWQCYDIIDYRDMTGEFKKRNPELFISEDAPKELQDLFYSKSITPQLLLKHPEYIEYLNGKDIVNCFKSKDVIVDNNYISIYTFLGSKMDFNSVINFITEYNDILDIIFDRSIADSYQYEIQFSTDDNIDQIKNRINELLRKIIIEKGVAYPNHIPKKLVETYPKMFLDNNAPQELREAFYNRTISSDFILSNPSYAEFLKNLDLEVLFEYMPVNVTSDEYRYKANLVTIIKQIFGSDDAFNVMLSYGKYIEKVFADNELQNFKFNPNFTKDELLDELDKTILQNIIDGNMKYDENIANHFKNNNSTLFLDQDVPQEIKDKFYNREFTLKDFNDNPELLDIFENTNIACAFSESMSWVIPLFSDSESIKIANYNRLKIISAYSKIQDVELQSEFKEYVMKLGTNIDVEKIEYVSEVLSRLSLSNSSEIFTFRKELATQILKSDNPLESLRKIEDVFIRSYIPTIGKIYSCFEILHPDFQGFNFESSMVSPVLKNASTMSKKVIVFSDLIKSSFGSNNKSVNAYLKNIEFGSSLYESIKSGQIQFNSLGEAEMRELTTFCNHLATLYNNTIKAKKNNETFTSTGYILTDIFELKKKLSPDGTLDYNLADRVIRMFCGFTGIDTLEQAKKYIERKVNAADSRNRDASSSDMVLEQGDFIKGIGDITYLRNILQNGSVSKEYLGSNADSDATPLDTDISMIMSSDGTISEKIDTTAAKCYGPIWFVLKNDDRFITTRTSSETLEAKRDASKMEVFYTGFWGEGHYGIRTGFASSEINYIVMENYDPRVGLEIAMNGFYIPVANKDGKIVFTPKDYDELRSKMSGLSYYGIPDYNLSKNLISEEILETKEKIIHDLSRTNAYVSEIKGYIYEAVKSAGILNVVNGFNSDLSQGIAEIYSTGSTSRNTNVPNDSDFDYLIKIDRALYFDTEKLEAFKSKMKEKLGFTDGFGGKICGKIKKDNGDELDIEISFCPRTDKVELSTDTSLSLKLEAIRKQYPDSYMDVLANIVYAKELFKSINAYKSLKSDANQGGLGGIGIENWILQHGGSFYDAAKDFVDKAEKAGSFENFKKIYQVYDLGDNHYSDKSGAYPHDNFVGDENKMGKDCYDRMVQALKEYLKKVIID